MLILANKIQWWQVDRRLECNNLSLPFRGQVGNNSFLLQAMVEQCLSVNNI